MENINIAPKPPQKPRRRIPLYVIVSAPFLILIALVLLFASNNTDRGVDDVTQTPDQTMTLTYPTIDVTSSLATTTLIPPEIVVATITPIETRVPNTCMAVVFQEVRTYESLLKDDKISFDLHPLSYTVGVGTQVGVRQECQGYVEIYSVSPEFQEFIDYTNTWVLKSAIQFEDPNCQIFQQSRCLPATP